MGGSATMRILGPWSRRYAIIDLFVSNWEPYPHQTAEFGIDVLNALRAVSGTAKPFGGMIDPINVPGGSIAIYEKAIVEINFGIPQIGVPVLTNVSNPRGRGDIISETFEPTTEYLSLNPDDFRWKLGEGQGRNLTEQEAPSKSEDGMEYLFTRHNIDTIPVAAWSHKNCVNDDRLYPLSPPLLHLRFDKETLLYRGMRAQRTADKDLATVKMSMTYRFSHREAGWNKFYRGDTGTWDEIVRKSDGIVHKNFELKDFTVF